MWLPQFLKSKAKSVILIIRFFTTNQRKKRFEVQLGEQWTVDCGLSTIIRSFK